MAAAAHRGGGLSIAMRRASALPLTNVQQDVQTVVHGVESESGFSAMRPNHEPTSEIPDFK